MFDPLPPFKVTICDLEHSAFVMVNIYPSGNRPGLRLTAWFNALVSTPYSVATSRSINTDCPRTTIILDLTSRISDIDTTSFFILSAVLLSLMFYKTICNTIQQSNPLQLHFKSRQRNPSHSTCHAISSKLTIYQCRQHISAMILFKGMGNVANVKMLPKPIINSQSSRQEYWR